MLMWRRSVSYHPGDFRLPHLGDILLCFPFQEKLNRSENRRIRTLLVFSSANCMGCFQENHMNRHDALPEFPQPSTSDSHQQFRCRVTSRLEVKCLASTSNPMAPMARKSSESKEHGFRPGTHPRTTELAHEGAKVRNWAGTKYI